MVQGKSNSGLHNCSLNLGSAKCGQNRILMKSNYAQLTEIYISRFRYIGVL